MTWIFAYMWDISWYAIYIYRLGISLEHHIYRDDLGMMYDIWVYTYIYIYINGYISGDEWTFGLDVGIPCLPYNGPILVFNLDAPLMVMTCSIPL